MRERSRRLWKNSCAARRALVRVPIAAVLQLWIGRFGEVRHSRLLGSTGDPQRDSALVESLRGVRVMQATPATLAQPLTILLLPKTTGKAMECKLTEGVGGS